jgi:hypothetical protein
MNEDPFPAVESAATHPTLNPTDTSSYKTQPTFTNEDIISANKTAKWGLILTIIPPTSTVGLVMCFIANSKLKKYKQDAVVAKIGIVIGIAFLVIGAIPAALTLLYLIALKSYGNS